MNQKNFSVLVLDERHIPSIICYLLAQPVFFAKQKQRKLSIPRHRLSGWICLNFVCLCIFMFFVSMFIVRIFASCRYCESSYMLFLDCSFFSLAFDQANAPGYLTNKQHPNSTKNTHLFSLDFFFRFFSNPHVRNVNTKF